MAAPLQVPGIFLGRQRVLAPVDRAAPVCLAASVRVFTAIYIAAPVKISRWHTKRRWGDSVPCFLVFRQEFSHFRQQVCLFRFRIARNRKNQAGKRFIRAVKVGKRHSQRLRDLFCHPKMRLVYAILVTADARAAAMLVKTDQFP
jgi:hypothetical protein